MSNKSPGRLRRKARRAAARAQTQKTPGSPETPTEPARPKEATATLQPATPAPTTESPAVASPAQTEASENAKKVFPRLWKWIAAFGLIIGIPASLVQLYSMFPRLIISADHLRDPTNATTTQFELVNDGMLNLHNTVLGLSIHKITYVNGPGSFGSVTFVSTNISRKVFRSGQKTTIPFDQLVSIAYPIKSASVTVWARYRPSFTASHVFKWQTFNLVQDSDGKAHWNPISDDFDYSDTKTTFVIYTNGPGFILR
jgi:hypothetical protein